MSKKSVLKLLLTIFAVSVILAVSSVTAFAANGVYSVAEGTEVVKAGEIPNEPGKDTNDSIIVVNIPSSVRMIEYGAFKNCPNIRIMNVDGRRNSVTFDPKYVFYTIHGLKVNYDTPAMDRVPDEAMPTTTTTAAPTTTTTTTTAPDTTTTTQATTETTTNADDTTTTTEEVTTSSVETTTTSANTWDEIISGQAAPDAPQSKGGSTLPMVLSFVGTGLVLILAIVLLIYKFKK